MLDYSRKQILALILLILMGFAGFIFPTEFYRIAATGPVLLILLAPPVWALKSIVSEPIDNRIRAFNILMISSTLFIFIGAGFASYWWVEQNPILFDGGASTSGELPGVYYQTRSLNLSVQAILLGAFSFILPLFLQFALQRLENLQSAVIFTQDNVDSNNLDVETLQSEVEDEYRLLLSLTDDASSYFYGGVIGGLLIMLCSSAISLWPGLDPRLYVLIPALNVFAVADILYILTTFILYLAAARPVKTTLSIIESMSTLDLGQNER